MEDREGKMGRWLVVVFGCALSLAACKTAEESWTEWKDISERESRVALFIPDDQNAPPIRRQARTSDLAYVRQERWGWQTGAAFLELLPRNRYSRQDPRDSGLLLEDMKNWKIFEEIDLKADTSMIEQGVNQLGVYFYLVSGENNADLNCFVYRQILPHKTASGYQDLLSGSAGFLVAFDCQPASSVSKQVLTKRMLAYVETIVLPY